MASFLKSRGLPLAAAFGVLLHAGGPQSAWGSEEVEPALAHDDECLAAGTEEEREQCSLNALQRRGLRVTAVAAEAQASKSNVTEGTKCGPLSAPENAVCASAVQWAAGPGKNDPHADEWYGDMTAIAGMDFRSSASLDDWQRLFFCAPPGGKQCGLPPCSCSKPPCDQCSADAKPAVRAGCEEDPDNIKCKPPKGPFDYKGMAWPTLTYEGVEEMHIFAVGDWGGMDGTLKPIEGRPWVVAYKWGARPGPSVFPRTRWNARHTVELCSHKQFITCFNSKGDDCPSSCGYVKGVDDQPQQLVAKAMQERAAKADPKFILNVGDNFYWGGIEKTCGTPMDQISYTARHQFDQIFEGVYNGPGLSGKPWLSVLGNHDWGGRQFNNGWDQQIAYTWASDRWVMPAPYYMVTADFPTQSFSVDMFMIDSNVRDAKDPAKDSEHNICGSAHNPPNANCGAIGGPESIDSCPQYFQDLWQEQKVWLEKQLSKSEATWQIMVTHFPCGEDGENQAWYRKLHQQFGLDLMVTGHRHDQELWLPTETWKNYMGGMTCIVTGGGGGITSEATPDPDNTEDWYGEAAYGFYDLVISKTMIKIQSINWDGKEVKSAWVYPM